MRNHTSSRISLPSIITSSSVALLIAAAPVFAGAPQTGADASQNGALPFTKRQLADCMTRRMVANRVLSYNDAAKSCKDQLRAPKTDAALTGTPKPVG